MSGAKNSVSGGIDQVGVGGINYRDSAQIYNIAGYTGNKNSFNQFDSADGNTDGWITRRMWLNTNWPDIRAVITWIVRGSMVDNLKRLPNDYDLEVYNPSGNYVTGAYNSVNPFDFVNFTINQSGFYTFRIKRDVNDDPGSRFGLALSVNSD